MFALEPILKMCPVLEICVIVTVCHMYRDVLPIFMYINSKYRTSNPSVTLGVMFFCQEVKITVSETKEYTAHCVKQGSLEWNLIH